MAGALEVDPLWVELRVKRAARSAENDLRELHVRGQQKQIVQIGALGKFENGLEDKTIYHENLQRVVYVFGEVAGRPPAVIPVVYWLLNGREEPAAEQAAS